MADLSAVSTPADVLDIEQPRVSLQSESLAELTVTEGQAENHLGSPEQSLPEQPPAITHQDIQEDLSVQDVQDAAVDTKLPTKDVPSGQQASSRTSHAPITTQPLPQTPRQHVANIRSELQLDQAADPGARNKLSDDLEGALETLARELYSEKNHFIWELVQNADDNRYAFGQIPTLTFSAEPGHVHISNNETGFLPANINSLCSVRNSTKKFQKETSIGEKGIGFKSVFRVATKVWLSSNGYTFRFDRDRPLGMIAPMWDPFPVSRIDSKMTHFYLNLSDKERDVDQKQLRNQLRGLDGATLLFLRKLRRIHLMVDDGKHTLYGKTSREILRVDQHKFGGEMARISTRRIQYRDVVDVIEYVMVRTSLLDMPAEEKRAGLSRSEVAIAFPFKGTRPVLFAQHAFAFLPMRMTDFRFLLQGDFILTASREDIARGNKWNERTLNGMVECFLTAVGRFNHEDARAIRYTWIAFLRTVELGSSNPFADLGDQIFDLLKTRPVLETQQGRLLPPKDLHFVPEAFRSRDQTFILFAESPYAYLSPQYDEWDATQKVIRRLGVNKVTTEHFLHILKEAATSGAATFRNHSNDWHGQLATIVRRSLARADVEDLMLIPLKNGRWVASNEGQVFFPPAVSTTSLAMPDGVSSLLTVDRIAAGDARRKEFFRWLKVKDLQVADVYNSVLELHSQPQPPDISLDELQSQLEFYYDYYVEMQSKNTLIAKPQQFWVVNTLRNPCLAKGVYHDYGPSSNNIVSSILSGEEWNSKMLLPNFMTSHQRSEEEAARWSEFLESHLKLKAHILITVDGANFTDEFTYIVKKLPAEQLLEILIVSWIQLEDSMKTNVLKEKLGALTVTSANGSPIRLSQSFLPTQALTATGIEGIPFLKVLSPDDQKWTALEAIGVVIKPDLKFYIFRLEKLRGKSVAKQEIRNLYDKIDACWYQDPKLIQAYFETHSAIYFPDDNIWLHKKDCVWAPTPTVEGERALLKVYPDLYTLFFTKVWVRTASIGSVIDELLAMAPPNQDEPERRKQLLMALNIFLLKDSTDSGKIDVLRDKMVMPTKNGSLQPLNKLTWIFGDRQKYRASFDGNTSTLFADFSVQDCIKLQPLAQAIRDHFGKEQRLSRLVSEEENYGVVTILNVPLTNHIRQKLRHIRSIVRDPRANAGRALDTIYGQLAGLKVYHAPKMSIIPHLKRGGAGAFISGKPLLSQQVLHRGLPNTVSFYIKDVVDSRKPSPAVLQHLSIELAKFCRIDDNCLKRLLQDVVQGLDEDLLDDQLAQENVECGQDLDYDPELLLDLDRSGFEDCDVPSASATTSPEFEATHDNIPIPSVSANPASASADSDGSTSYSPDSESDNNTVQAVSKPFGKTILYHEASSANFDLIEVEPCQLRTPGLRSRPAPMMRASGRPADLSQYIKNPLRRPHKMSPKDSLQQSDNGFLSAPCHPRVKIYRAPTEEQQSKERKIGLTGEILTWQLLREIFGSTLSDSVWTSELREVAIGSAWSPEDPTKTYTDFTVTDDERDNLTHWLQEQKVKLPLRILGEKRTYHIEVKATASPDKLEAWFMSSMQAKLAKRLKGRSDHVFLIFRWYKVDAQGGDEEMRIIADPMMAKEEGRLGMEAAELRVWEIVSDDN